MAKKSTKSGTEEVEAYMAQLAHPFKEELETLRALILEASPKMQERIKWNVPSFYYQIDMAAFHPRETKRVHVVFVFPPGKMVPDPGGLLEGDYKDRRMMYFANMPDLQSKKDQLQTLVRDWVALVDSTLS